jgi:hypothetical protein
MELWTVAVIIVESTAQIFYQALKDATKCTLLKQICTDILIDEAYHITFQTERLGHDLCKQKQFLKKLADGCLPMVLLRYFRAGMVRA